MSNRELVDIVFGASSGIGQALVVHWANSSKQRILACSRFSSKDIEFGSSGNSVSWRFCDYTDESLAEFRGYLKNIPIDISRLVICNGVLHGDGFQPERALNQIKNSSMRSVFEVNAFLPMRILAAVAPALKMSSAPKIVVLSARVGSIGDNNLGGWYSYRGSKAALNMMLKSASLEFRRLNRSATFLAYHPGTVETALSQPFKSSVKAASLMSPTQAAEALNNVIDSLGLGEDFAYLDWQGKPIPW